MKLVDEKDVFTSSILHKDIRASIGIPTRHAINW